MKKTTKQKLIPLVLTALVIGTDQISKMIVAGTLPVAKPVSIVGDFLRFTYVQNPAAAFGIGRDLPSGVQRVLFFVLPLAVIVGVTAFYFAANELSQSQLYAIAAALGGGISNQVDRIIRSDGVVDFVDVKFYGLFGLERWPVFNIADSVVVVAGVFLIFTFLIAEAKTRKRT